MVLKMTVVISSHRQGLGNLWLLGFVEQAFRHKGNDFRPELFNSHLNCEDRRET